MLRRALGILWASIINTIGPSFLTFGHLNIPRVLEGCSNLISVWFQVGKMLAPGDLLGA